MGARRDIKPYGNTVFLSWSQKVMSEVGRCPGAVAKAGLRPANTVSWDTLDFVPMPEAYVGLTPAPAVSAV